MTFKLLRFALIASVLTFTNCTREKKVEVSNSFRVNLNPSDSVKDPLFNLNQERLKVLSLVYESLLGYSNGGSDLAPILLAELPTLSADQLTYTFKLKAGVHFHPADGIAKDRSVKPEDAVMSLLRGVSEDNSSNYANLLTGVIDGLAAWSKKSPEEKSKNLPSGIKITNDLEFSIRLLRKYPDFLGLLTLPAFSVVPHELLSGGKLTKPVGTGPYKFEDLSIDGKNWNLARSPNLADTVKLKYPGVSVTESSDLKDVQNSDYSSLPIKLATQVIDPATGALKNLPDHELQELRIKRLEMLVFNLKDPLVKALGVDFRRAIYSVIDFNVILNGMYHGFSLNSIQFIPPGVEGSLEDPKVKSMSFADAQKKIAKALKNKKLKIQFPESAAYWISELQQNLEKVGPFFDFESIDASTYLDKVEKSEFQVAPLSWEGDLPEATNFLQLYYGASQSNAQNVSGYKNASFDAAFDKLSKLFPSPERKKLAENAHEIVLRDLPAIPLGFKKEFAIISKRSAGLNAKAFGASSLKDFLLE